MDFKVTYLTFLDKLFSAYMANFGNINNERLLINNQIINHMNPNKALWEKGDFTKIAATMRESGEELVRKLEIK